MDQKIAATKPALSGKDAAPSLAYSAHAIHLVRTAQINTLTLSQMADQKASILIGATFVVFSLVVTKLVGSAFTLSILCLSLTAFVSSFCAVYAVLPSSKGGAPSEEGANLLFFANFAAMDEAAWQEAVLENLHHDEALFRVMLRDVHQNGQVLYRRKYRFLSYAYRVFLGGLFLTLLAYLAEMVFGLEPLVSAS
ncbi:MAG: Pycsar system effector family protein [Pseudomonadota bacterium]